MSSAAKAIALTLAAYSGGAIATATKRNTAATDHKPPARNQTLSGAVRWEDLCPLTRPPPAPQTGRQDLGPRTVVGHILMLE